MYPVDKMDEYEYHYLLKDNTFVEFLAPLNECSSAYLSKRQYVIRR